MPAVAGRFIIGKEHWVLKLYPMNCVELRGNIDARPPYWVNHRETGQFVGNGLNNLAYEFYLLSVLISIGGASTSG